MAKYTENIRLAQPEGSDYYDIEVFNHNSELIDKKIGEMDNSLSTIKEGATREKAGIVQLGTEEGKALEGMMLARLAGCIGYGGDIQDEGVKNPNYIYYDRNTRKMYKCLKQNQDISANVANFIPLDNNSLLERLENLFTNIIELGKNITKNTTIPELKNYKFWKVELIISNIPNQISHQRYVFTVNSAIGFSHNDNYHYFGLYSIDISKNGNIIMSGSAVDKGFIKVNIYGVY